MNISSIVISTKQQDIDAFRMALNELKHLCEYHLHDESGKFVVTIEGEGVEEEIAKLQELQRHPLVVSAEMVFSYSEDELNENMDQLNKNDKMMPDWLNDPNATLKDIKYQGDLKGKY